MTAAAPTAPGLAVDRLLAGPCDTAALGRRLGAVLRAGDAVLLSGPMGAGKSHLARAAIRARVGGDIDVPSPSYTLVQTYEARDGTAIWHADLHRLSGPDEAAELGLDEAWEDAICLVEWPDRLGPDAPPGALALALSPEGSGRRLAARSDGPRWAEAEDALRG